MNAVSNISEDDVVGANWKFKGIWLIEDFPVRITRREA
jgi:hypothetical protein